MKTSRYTEAQIIAILRQAEGGVPVSELCREHGMSDASFYKWRAKYGGMDASMVGQMKAIEDENRRLKRQGRFQPRVPSENHHRLVHDDGLAPPEFLDRGRDRRDRLLVAARVTRIGNDLLERQVDNVHGNVLGDA